MEVVCYSRACTNRPRAGGPPVSEIAGKWLRVSTMAQDEQSQEPDLDRWISQYGYEAGPTYRVQGLSAYHGKQEPELRRAMADMKAGRLSVLVVWKSDRL